MRRTLNGAHAALARLIIGIRFRVGQLIQHKLFDYRGVVFDVDATFQGSAEWYETMARSRPPKDRPWYPRGGLPIDVFYQTGPPPEGLWLPDQGVPAYRGRG